MISIIVTTYNRKELLRGSVKSILNQSFFDLELIIIDDGSVDGTEEMIKNDFNDSRIRYIKITENKGATHVRNFGISQVKGEFFMLWDSDDILYRDALEKVMKVFEDNDSVVIVSAPAKSILNDKEIKYPNIDEGVIDSDRVKARLLPSNHKIRVAKTSLCRNVRYHSKNIDFLVNVALAECGPWYCIDEYLGEIRLLSTKNSLTLTRKKTDLNLSIERAKYLSEYLEKYKELLIKKNPVVYAGLCYGVSVGYLVKNFKFKAFNYIKESLVYNFRIKYILFAIFILFPFSKNILNLLVKIKNFF